MSRETPSERVETLPPEGGAPPSPPSSLEDEVREIKRMLSALFNLFFKDPKEYSATRKEYIEALQAAREGNSRLLRSVLRKTGGVIPSEPRG